MNEGTVLIRITRDLASFFGTRTEDGRKLTFDLGEPVEHTSKLEGEPVYEPTIHASDDGKMVVDRETGIVVALPVIELASRSSISEEGEPHA